MGGSDLNVRHAHIDELEAETLCRAKSCRGNVRLAKVRSGDTSGFVGGLA